MAQSCSTNYVCTPIWYDSSAKTEEGGEDVIAYAAGPHAVDLNVVCFVGSGTIQFQVKDPDGNWFTPAEASYTVQDSNCVRYLVQTCPMFVSSPLTMPSSTLRGASANASTN